MSIWDKDGLITFKQEVKGGKIYLEESSDSDESSKILKIHKILNYLLVWVAELEEERGKENDKYR